MVELQKLRFWYRIHFSKHFLSRVVCFLVLTLIENFNTNNDLLRRQFKTCILRLIVLNTATYLKQLLEFDVVIHELYMKREVTVLKLYAFFGR